MLKYLSVVIFLSLALKGSAQKVLIKGYIETKDRKSDRLEVVVNDTIVKFFSDVSNYKPANSIKYTALIKDANLITRPAANGYFQIYVNPKDSLIIYGYRYVERRIAVADLLQEDTVRIAMQKQQCIDYVPCEKGGETYAFIGELLSIKHIEEDYYCQTIISMDTKYLCTYKVISYLEGNLNKDTVSFYTYSHYSTPGFAYYKNSIIYLQAYCGKLLSEKYKYTPLFKTVDDQWATPYFPDEYKPLTEFLPEKIAFKTPMEFDISRMRQEDIEKEFPSDYFEISGNTAKLLYGFYVNQAFLLKKERLVVTRDKESIKMLRLKPQK